MIKEAIRALTERRDLTSEECAQAMNEVMTGEATPAQLRHIAMSALLADPALLSATGRYLLVCASGKRSLAAARELRKKGLAVHSLAGGLQMLGR